MNGYGAEPIVIGVKRRGRASEKLLRGVMAVCAALFLLLGVLFSSAFMLPCFLMTAAYFVYGTAARREYEYTLEDGRLRIERVSDRGRRLLRDLSLEDVQLLCLPDDPAAAPFRKGGTERVPKYDYTSYEPDISYYTMIALENGEKIKLLLDLTPEAVRMVRRFQNAAGHA